MGKLYTDQMRINDYTEYYKKRTRLQERRKEFKEKRDAILKLVNSSRMTMAKFFRKIKEIKLDSEV